MRNAARTWAQDQAEERAERLEDINDFFESGGASLRELIEYSDSRLDALTGSCLTDALNEARTLLSATNAYPALRRYLDRFSAAQEAYKAECVDIDYVPGLYEQDCQTREAKL